MSRRMPPIPVAAPWNGSTAEGWLWLSTLKATASPSPRSTTPAFSPGPWRTRGDEVGKRRRSSEKTASSKWFGSRPSRSQIRSSSPSVRPRARWSGCSATCVSHLSLACALDEHCRDSGPCPAVTVETRYAKTGDIHIAYQVVGDGPVDIVLAAEFWHSIEVPVGPTRPRCVSRAACRFRPPHLLRPAGQRRLGPGLAPRAEVARAVDGRHPRRHGRGAIGERRAVRDRRGWDDEHALRGDLPAAGLRAHPRQQLRAPVSRTRLPVGERARAGGRGPRRDVTGWGRGVFLDL